MKDIKQFFRNFLISAKSDQSKIYREWDRQRARAKTPSELSEIDAIFSRYT